MPACVGPFELGHSSNDQVRRETGVGRWNTCQRLRPGRNFPRLWVLAVDCGLVPYDDCRMSSRCVSGGGWEEAKRLNGNSSGKGLG